MASTRETNTRETNTAAQQHLGELLNAGEIDRIDEVFAADVLDHDKAPDQGEAWRAPTASSAP